MPAIRTVYRSSLFNLWCYRGKVAGELFDRRCVDLYLLLGFRKIALFDRFPDARQGLDTVACIEAGSIDAMPVPWAAGQTVIRQQLLFRPVKRFVDSFSP